jgi:predicted kinase
MQRLWTVTIDRQLKTSTRNATINKGATMSKGVLTFFCGKMGAGKSTKASEIARESHAVLLSEDEWLASLYPNKISSLNDYIEYSNLLKPQIKKLVQAMLSAGTNVVMDFPANTISQRSWFRSIFSEIEAPHQLVYIDVPHDVCLKQIGKRRQEQPERATTDTPEMFAQVTKYFMAPTSEEGFTTTKLT